MHVSKAVHGASNAELAKSPGLEILILTQNPCLNPCILFRTFPHLPWPRFGILIITSQKRLSPYYYGPLWPIMGQWERANEYQHRSERDNSSKVSISPIPRHPRNPMIPYQAIPIQRHVTGSVTTCLTDSFWPIPGRSAVAKDSYLNSKVGIIINIEIAIQIH